MGILSKIFTAMRGHASEAGEAIVDANALTIMDQEIRDADNEMRKSRDNLATVMAKRQLSADKLAAKQAKIKEYGGYIQAALGRNDEALATEVAAKLADLEGEVVTEDGLVKEYDESITSLKKSILEAEDRIKRLKVKVDVVKARQHVIQAQRAASTANVGANSRVGAALESLDRIQNRQAEQSAKIKAADQLAREGTTAGLEDKLRAAGITPGAASAQDVLARFRKPAG
ncbi:MAG: PspA/IM30 family protein [Fibrobacterota bacterium]|nr:PspA/IM30 family protein [Fibrobacterota bacterium]QQS07305.1 MAG: PspA/IM30 family protein [Fibrobacterota bacterium]